MTRFVFAFALALVLFLPNAAAAFHAPPWDTGHQSFQPDDGDDDNNPGDDACPDPDKCRESRYGSPVEIATGNLFYATGLFTIGGAGPSIDAVLSYNSRDNRIGPFGRGWVHPYDQRVIETTDGVSTFAIISQPDGKRETFQRRPDGSYQSPPHLFVTLTKRSDGSFEARDRFGWLRQFDAQGRLTSIVDRNGNALSFLYDSAGFLTTIASGSGRLVTLVKGGDGHVQSLVAPTSFALSFNYDANGNLGSISGPGGETTAFQYDTRNNLSAVIDARGNRPLEATYDTQNRVATYTEDGLRWTMTYNTAARQTTKRDVGNRAWVYTYNAAGVITQARDALNQVETFEYDANLNLTGYVNKRGQRWTYIYDAQANLIQEVDPFSNVTTNTYGAFNLPLTKTDRRGSVSRFAYSATGDLSRYTSSTNEITTFEHDGRGLITKVVDPARGESLFSYDSHGHLVGVVDPLGNTTTATYDPLGRVIENRNAEGITQRYLYDPAGRLVELRDSIGNSAHNEYDANGNLTAVVDPAGRRTAFSYDAFNRVLTITRPSGGVTTLTYDARGLLASRRDPNGSLISYAYDALDRMSSKTRPDTTAFFTYDATNNMLSARDGRSHLTFAYDALNRVTRAATLAMGGYPATALDFAYDEEGNRTSMAGPDGTTNYEFDIASQLTRLTNPAGQTFVFIRDALSRRTRLQRSNGITTTYGYDPASRLTSLSTDLAAPMSQSFEYDRSGNLTQMTGTEGAATFQYDGLARLSRTDQSFSGLPSRTELYSFNSVGDRTTSHLSPTHTYNPGGQLVGDADFIYAYDGNGNMLSRTSRNSGLQTTYIYNADNQLTQVRLPNGSVVTYSYDVFGRRITKNVGGTTVHFVYDKLDIVAEYTGSTLSATFTHGPLMDELLAVRRGGLASYAIADRSGSIVRYVDLSGATIAARTYDSHGVLVQSSGVAPASYGYHGREFDVETGLYYLRARYYSPDIGRFLSEDPLPFFGGYNVYAFVGGNPVNQTDLTGLIVETGWDFANLVIGGASLGANIASGNVVGALVDAAGLIVDGVATAIPGVPAGASTAINIYRGSKLARNMAKAGRPVKKGVEACHHMVAQAAKKAAKARDKLKEFGIDVDDAANGIGLPKKFHEGLHTDDYYDAVDRAADGWKTRDDAINGLENIRQILLQRAK